VPPRLVVANFFLFLRRARAAAAAAEHLRRDNRDSQRASKAVCGQRLVYLALMKSALFFLGIVALAAATPIPFTNCGTSTDLVPPPPPPPIPPFALRTVHPTPRHSFRLQLKVNSIDVSPNPPKKGDTVAVSFEGELLPPPINSHVANVN
jgi:hypothetical protein